MHVLFDISEKDSFVVSSIASSSSVSVRENHYLMTSIMVNKKNDKKVEAHFTVATFETSKLHCEQSSLHFFLSLFFILLWPPLMLRSYYFLEKEISIQN